MKIEIIKDNTVKFIQVLMKIIFKMGLIVTGASTFFMGWVETPYGTFPIVQIFGTLNILAAIGWEFVTHTTKNKKSK